MDSVQTSESPATPSAWDRMAGIGVQAGPARKRSRLLPDPDPRPRYRPIVSVDDHIIEPPDIFDGRIPAKFIDAAPRVVEDEFGNQSWHIGSRTLQTLGLSAVVGLPQEEWNSDPLRFEDMRKGCWDISSRVKDMDIGGIWGSLCFPSGLTGFAGRNFAKLPDKELGLALTRAYNQWHLEEWYAGAPDRIIPMQIPWLADPVVAAEEIRKNAALGFKAVTFTENPVGHKFPSLHTDHWEPFMRACEETGTVVCLHAASSTWNPVQADDAPRAEHTTLFAINSITAAADWVWSGIPVRYPDIKIVLAEGGTSWVPMMIERLDYVLDHSLKGDPSMWPDTSLMPSEVFRRNFWFCMLEDPAGITLRHTIGVENMMVEADYPHSDSTWPDTQPLLERLLGSIPADEADAIAYKNACKLFRHPLPNVEEWVNQVPVSVNA